MTKINRISKIVNRISKFEIRSRGQAITEMLFILPLFVVLSVGMVSVGYMCMQGMKVQEAANLAARIQGQERVLGGPDVTRINQDNGVDGGGDKLPTGAELYSLKSDQLEHHKPAYGVYAKVYSTIQSMFSAAEQKGLLIPPPKQGVNSDQVQVVRVLTPPKILNLPNIPLQATAYGGEDPHMYGLPRWGHVGVNTGNSNGTGLFWQNTVTSSKGND